MVSQYRKGILAQFSRVPCCGGECHPQPTTSAVTFAEDGGGKALESSLCGLLESEMEEVNALAENATIPFEVVLDSGAAEHVSDSVDVPG